jgi:GNAT superfamily N-acetyltransferase
MGKVMIQGYTLTTDQGKMDFNVIHAFISQSYWAKDIPVPTLQKAMANSLCFAALLDSGEQVGFARVISDYATFAYLADVFVLEAHRGKGISKRLMQFIVDHPDLQGLRRTVLATADAHGLYSQYGFTALAKPENFMESWHPNIYQRT